MDKSLFACAVILMLVGCKSKKPIIQRDTVFIRDTFTRTVLDSVFIVKTKEVQTDINERADSVIIRTVKDTIMVRKYGTSKQTALHSKEIQDLERKIKELSEKSKETSQVIVKEDPKPKKKWSFWKWVAIFEGGAILVLLGFSAMKYVKLINFSFFKK